MMNFQQSYGEFSPNINGDNNQTNQNIGIVKVGFAYKVRYTFIGFIIGVATSFIGSYLYDSIKNVKFENIQTEVPAETQNIKPDSIK